MLSHFLWFVFSKITATFHYQSIFTLFLDEINTKVNVNDFSIFSSQFHATGRPFSLQNCSVSNQSADSMQVECVEGFDGGLPQGFLLELVEMPALRLVRNLSLPVSVLVYIYFFFSIFIFFLIFLAL